MISFWEKWTCLRSLVLCSSPDFNSFSVFLLLTCWLEQFGHIRHWERSKNYILSLNVVLVLVLCSFATKKTSSPYFWRWLLMNWLLYTTPTEDVRTIDFPNKFSHVKILILQSLFTFKMKIDTLTYKEFS